MIISQYSNKINLLKFSLFVSSMPLPSQDTPKRVAGVGCMLMKERATRVDEEHVGKWHECVRAGSEKGFPPGL